MKKKMISSGRFHLRPLQRTQAAPYALGTHRGVERFCEPGTGVVLYGFMISIEAGGGEGHFLVF